MAAEVKKLINNYILQNIWYTKSYLHQKTALVKETLDG